MFRSVLLIVIASLMTGCVVTTSTLPSVDRQQVAALSLSDKADQKNEQFVEGARVKISDPTFPEDVSAIVGRSYRSALGLECYRVRMAEPDAVREPVSLCRRNNGSWFVAPHIWSRTIPIPNVSQ